MITRLDAAAEKTGYSRASLIRYCAETWLSYWEIHKEDALPANWDKIMAGLDGRTIESRDNKIREGKKYSIAKTTDFMLNDRDRPEKRSEK